jgi:hypothetical protein
MLTYWGKKVNRQGILRNFQESANADGVVGGEPASHHVDPGSIPGSGVVICDLVDALGIALPLRVCAVSFAIHNNQMGEGKYANKTIGTWLA